jgi:hypothetical protein
VKPLSGVAFSVSVSAVVMVVAVSPTMRMFLPLLPAVALLLRRTTSPTRRPSEIQLPLAATIVFAVVVIEVTSPASIARSAEDHAPRITASMIGSIKPSESSDV